MGAHRNMKRVIFRGPVLTQSGYGVHSRQVARWLLSNKDIDVKFHTLPWGSTPWILNGDMYDGLAAQIMKRTVDEKYRADVSFQLQLPNEWNTNIATYNVGMTAGVETDVCNPEWINRINTMDQVIVPSQHVKNTFQNSGKLLKDVSVIPESYIDDVRKSSSELPTYSSFSTDFNFLVFGQITGDNHQNDRKNTFNTIKWLCETFKDDKNVGIVLKTNAGRNTKLDRNHVVNMFRNFIKGVRKGQYPKIHLLHGDFSDPEVASLYRHPQIKALVAISRGEGYGLPILEAAASALPVIATNWSGHLDFLNKGRFVAVDYSLDEVHKSRIDGGIFISGSKWANPLEEDFKRKVSKFRTSPTIPKDWAIDLSKKLIQEYSYEQISALYDQKLGHILK